ncbi:MAG: hypothetical protein R3C56_42710 [Pirellulaceae bacterium]
MKEHSFTLILARDPSDDESDLLYGKIDDGTISTIAGVPQISFDRESDSLESAIRSTLSDVPSSGFPVSIVEKDPNSVL